MLLPLSYVQWFRVVPGSEILWEVICRDTMPWDSESTIRFSHDHFFYTKTECSFRHWKCPICKTHEHVISSSQQPHNFCPNIRQKLFWALFLDTSPSPPLFRREIVSEVLHFWKISGVGCTLCILIKRYKYSSTVVWLPTANSNSQRSMNNDQWPMTMLEIWCRLRSEYTPRSTLRVCHRTTLHVVERSTTLGIE